MHEDKKLFMSPRMTKLLYLRSFFTARMTMPPHLVLVDILLKFQAQLHQPTPNDVASLSKYVWAVASFRGLP
jgi:hypothetical protein